MVNHTEWRSRRRQMFDDFEREVWRDALEVAHKKGYASRSRKEIIDRYWSDELEDDDFDYEECRRLVGGAA